MDWQRILTWIAGLALVGMLALAWLTASDNEVVWFMVPVLALFRMIGGTWNKAIGRFLPPIVIAGAYLIFIGWSWWILAILAAYLLLATLPVSLIGNGVNDHWFNWVWMWILGLLNGLACVTLGIPLALVATSLFLSLVPMVVYGTSFTFSNIKATAKYFPWKMCEFLMGASAAIPPAMLIDLAR